MMHLKKISLLAIACMLVGKRFDNSLHASVPTKSEPGLSDYYDPYQLKILEDSLKQLDPRNEIMPIIGGFVKGHVFFSVVLYSAAQQGDEQNVNCLKDGLHNNRCIAGSMQLADVITPCAYDPSEAFVRVSYHDEKTEELYFRTIVKSASTNSDARVACAYALVEQ